MGFGGALDTPRTNLGDATYLSRAPDFADISQEASFQSPGKDGNLLQQLRNGRSSGVNLRTPRQRGPLADRRNLPASVGGAEFTPLLKSATRNSVRRHGKENGAAVFNTPALDRIDEDDMTPVPRMDTSVYLGSRNQSYLDNTLPQVDSSSVASTPMALQPRRGGDKGPLQDGNQLSLREQENVIDRIEKENFGLKLKIHFLEDALRKAGPGFGEAALKENTELKVDKVTMQRELHRYKKHLTTAERDLETYRQQMTELQEKSKRKQFDESQRAELEELQRTLEEREADIDDLQRQLDQSRHDQDEVEKLRDNIEDLEADMREKDRLLTERDDELEDVREKLEEAEVRAKDAQRKMLELEQAEQHQDELDEAKETIEELETNIRRLEEQLDEMKEKMDEAAAERARAEQDLEELQEEMADKSVVTKGLSRQIEEKVTRLQDELDKSGKEYAALEKQLTLSNQEKTDLQATVSDLRRQQKTFENGQESEATRIRELETELLTVADERDLLQSRHDTVAGRCTLLEQDVERLEGEAADLERSLSRERELALDTEKDLRSQYQDEIERLNDEVSDLQAEVREKDNLYDNDCEKWENEKQTLESERERIEERAAGLQRTIDRLREAEGNLSSKESKLKGAIESETERHKSEEAVMTRQINDLQDALETRQTLLTALRNELSAVRDELRQTQIDYQTQVNKVVALEDEVELLRTRSPGKPSLQLDFAQRECEKLRAQLDEAQKAERSADSTARLKWQLSDATSQLDKAAKDKHSLQEQLATLTSDLQSVRTSLAEASAERDELDAQLRRSNSHGNVDQERLDLRTAKMKLEGEVRRLKDENKSLAEQRAAVEKTLDDEIEKAAAEEERLGQEVLDLQAKVRQSSSSSSQELVAARRTIRELQRRIDDYEGQLAGAKFPDGNDNSGDLSMVRKDLHASRQKELEFLQREAAHRDLVKGLKRQIADLEGQMHDQELTRLARSPASSPAKSERSLRGTSDIKTMQAMQDLREQLSDLEDQKIVLEEVLEEARQQAGEASEHYEKAMERLQHKLDKACRERDAAAAASQAGTGKQTRHLRKTQTEIENLEHDVCQQQELIDGFVASEACLRRKLERARSERAAYRMTAEKLQRDIQTLKTSASVAGGPLAARDQRALAKRHGTDEALETVVRAAESAEERHNKELRGVVMQMDWMQARWEREAMLRSDAAYAKRFLQLQLDVANAWYVLDPFHSPSLSRPVPNKAQLRELEHIRTNLLHSRKPLALPGPGGNGGGEGSGSGGRSKPTSIRPFLVAARFIARMRISARDWAKQEAVRRRLVAATEEVRRTKRSRQLKVVRVTEDK
ncbi:LOW QUALITY PROTEIN: spindle-pole body protein (Pcp1) [Purpureocillium lavendulum]|uniref:Spindle-pole body protein (Pcp1) n=1 Tax=Purpureocillium lavendulum TaxID=1247861 RepID=A0AB34FP08_9HYPO|nr:LOW QUALITY PROTEIN: spindle-pole body protein (Pcp1) [Purpureocillium lavendulum]